MRFILRTMLLPLRLLLSVITSIITFLLCIMGAGCGVISVIVSIIAVAAFIAGETTGGIAFLVIAVLVSLRLFCLLRQTGLLIKCVGCALPSRTSERSFPYGNYISETAQDQQRGQHCQIP